MQKIASTDKCSGCHACYNACPVNAIKMQIDSEGFIYPNIDANACINCGKCSLVCPVLNEYIGKEPGQAYACMNKDEEIREISSSGGIFSLIANYVIEQRGVVFGAAFDKDFNVEHIEVSNIKDLSKLRGSKYLQSRIGSTYKQAENYLKQGILVLYSGTPCQISGLKSYLKKEYENLILLDIICHGVPSPMVWQKYLNYREKIACSRTKKVYFRQKKHGWNSYCILLEFSNHTQYEQIFRKDLFMQSFLKNLCLRPSCYDCHSKSLNRESDITLADFWGVEKILPEMFDDKGTSLVFVNSNKGVQLFNKISCNMFYREVDINDAVKYNSSAYKSVALPKNRKKFMKLVRKIDFDKAISKAINVSTAKKAIIKLKIVIKALYGLRKNDR